MKYTLINTSHIIIKKLHLKITIFKTKQRKAETKNNNNSIKINKVDGIN